MMEIITIQQNEMSAEEKTPEEEETTPMEEKRIFVFALLKIETEDSNNSEFFSDVPFSSLELSGSWLKTLLTIEKTMEVLEHMNFKTMTPIQAKAIPALLSGKDVLGAAK